MDETTAPELPIALAATVLVVRDSPRGPEVLLVRRATSLVFHGGAWVFPGGRVDADELRLGDPLASARAAAVRETQEEAGLSLNAEALVPFSHWTTPHGRPRRFATWFFAAALEAHRDVVVDGAEISEHRWLTPAAALAWQARGELELPPPTFVTLSVVQAHASAAALLEHARAVPPAIYVPRLRRTPAGELALYHGDVAYEGGDLDQPGPRHRLYMFASGWRYELPSGLDRGNGSKAHLR